MALEMTTDDLAQGCKVVRAVGEIDLHSVELFEETFQDLLANQPKSLLIDLTGIRFMSSSGIGVLMTCNAAYEGTDGKLVLILGDGTVRESLKLIGILDLIPVVASEQEALARIGL